MASAKIVVFAVLVLLLQVSSCAVARRHHEPDPCRDTVPPGLMRHKDRRRCSSSPDASAHGGTGTPAVMTVNGFERGQEGGGPSECDGHFHSDREMVVALSTRWYAHGRRCHKTIRITSAHNRRTVEARVVDECDSRRGCKDNIVDTSKAVWEALGLDTNLGEVPVTWSDA
ncbi:putative ripening-related protein 6 [Phragmites australis]|uniref:putative ripening-related protein 6 n=1 Tax=Phragmites australis TaxID=29695 RepID=UPI002D7A0BF5|nr:putative ripening-related protein 6 [Phragmites australis]